MHEMSLAESVIQIVEDCARREGAQRVLRVCLEIGDLAAVERESMRFCFDAVTRGGVADGAALDIVDTPGSAWCMDCSASIRIANLADDCPRCGSRKVQVTGGTEMKVREIELA